MHKCGGGGACVCVGVGASLCVCVCACLCEDCINEEKILLRDCSVMNSSLVGFMFFFFTEDVYLYGTTWGTLDDVHFLKERSS